MTWTKPVLSLLAAGTLAASAAAAAAAEARYTAPPLASAVSEGGTLPIAKSEKVYSGTAVTIDGAVAAHIAIYADLDGGGQPIRWIVAQDGATRFAMMQGAEIAFAKTPDVKLDDLNGDGQPELLVYRKGAGEGSGALGLGVYEIANRYFPLFDVTDPSFTDPELERRYELGRDSSGGLRFKDPVSGLTAVLAGGDAEKARVEPVSNYEFGDRDGDGVKEVTAVQRIAASSAAGAPALALLKTRYELAYGAYSPVAQFLEDATGHVIAKTAMPQY